ncbi:MAG: radical SAM protein [Firmicutes bacterium]|nr:radical SAM protein [Bacillota bacterium]
MVISNIKKIENDLEDIVKLFFSTEYKKVDIIHAYFKEGENDINRFYLYGTKYYAIHNFAEYYANIDKMSLLKRASKADLYNILAGITGKHSPFGSLTGIRPVKFYKDVKTEFTKMTGVDFADLNKKSIKDVDGYFTKVLKVSQEKLDLIKRTYSVQSKMAQANKNDCGIYIGIPFCNGRCRYCSFVSADINKCGNLVEPYINALTREIEALKGIITQNGLSIRSIYIGGGTPSSLPLKLVKKVLESVETLTKKSCINTEYTFEAGRPDSINESLLKLLKKHNVNRISINPQSANNKTLERIGRGHSFEDVQRAFKLAKDFNFIINTDIIAGLEGERLSDFKNTLLEVLKLNPDNITVHTLCLKKGSDLKNVLLKTNFKKKNFNELHAKVIDINESGGESKNRKEANCELSSGRSSISNLLECEGLAKAKIGENFYNSIVINEGAELGAGGQFDLRFFEAGVNIGDFKRGVKHEQKEYLKITIKNVLGQSDKECYKDDNKVSKMLKFAQNKLISKKFHPYYVYRQKYSAENLENVGYCRPEHFCLYNVDNMDDTVSILACGANSITKYVKLQSAIERYANPKDIKTYIEKADKIIKDKRNLFGV